MFFMISLENLIPAPEVQVNFSLVPTFILARINGTATRLLNFVFLIMLPFSTYNISVKIPYNAIMSKIVTAVALDALS